MCVKRAGAVQGLRAQQQPWPCDGVSGAAAGWRLSPAVFLEVPSHFLLVIRSPGATTAPPRSLASEQIRHTDANTADSK